MRELTCFKANDIRGKLGAELNEDVVRRIGRAFAEGLKATRVVVGRDCRASSEALLAAAAEGLVAGGVEVLDLGLCGTEEMYFAVSHSGADGGIEVTASHNPLDYNGLKLVRQGSAPLDASTGLATIKALAEGPELPSRPGGRVVAARGARAAYVQRVLSFVDIDALRPLTILVNAGNGAAGPTFDEIALELEARGAPLRFLRMHHQVDATFPNGIPNPLLPENQIATAEAVVAAGADMGVAWDGDFDRCFLFDKTGRFIPGEYVVGILAEIFLQKEPGATIVHDPRIIWNIRDVVANAGGVAVQTRTGHAFLKQSLRETGAVYGGEMSAHHYFRDFMSCDSGMIPWLLVAELMSRKDRSLSDLVTDRMAAFPSSGEINFQLNDPGAAIARIEAALAPLGPERDDTDGLSLAFPDWRLNLRRSNTEPLLRLNVEARGDAGLVARKVTEITALVQAEDA
jgi:phosphomannomutase